MNRLKKIRQKARRRPLTIPVWLRYLGGIVVAALLIVAGFAVFPDTDGYLLNLYTELAGVIVTIVFVNTFLYSQGEKRREKELIERMLQEARSPETVISGNALHEIEEYISRSRDYSFLEGKLFRGANWENVKLFRPMNNANLDYARIKNSELSLAELRGAYLGWVELDNVRMSQVVLSNSYMHRIKMKKVNVYHSNLSHVYMTSAILEDVNLINVNLTGADLGLGEFVHVNFANADLSNANLSDASLLWSDLTEAIFNEQTKLPDESYWNPAIDVRKFSDPDHPEFWLADDRMSPAYFGYHERQLERFSKDKRA